MSSKVFVNRVLNLKKITHLGLDMDHTLIRYRNREFEALTYKLALDQLVDSKGYPKEVLNLPFDFDLAIRGLVLDIKNGNTLKLSRFGAIRSSRNGTEKIDFAEQKRIYRSKYIDLSSPGYVPVDTTFSISYCVLYARLIDLKKVLGEALPSYEEIANDISDAIDLVHRDGSLKRIVSRQLDKYVIKDEKLVQGLLKYKQHGKKVFLITNSEYSYTKTILDYAVTPFMPEGQTWHNLFDYTICWSQKPRFFYDKLKFLRINTEDGDNHGTMTNVEKLEPGVYQGGCAAQFTADLGLSGDEILYVGDHIYGDVVRLKKDCNWRTALVIEELDEEVQNFQKAEPLQREIDKRMAAKEPLEEEMLLKSTSKIENHSNDHDKEIQELQEKISDIDAEISQLIPQIQALYNKNWGPVFRAGNEESYFATQVDRYACIYMAKLTDLLAESPRKYFRSHRRELPHEVV